MASHPSAPIADHHYAVVDTETTGLDPDGGDEILELSIVRIAADGSRQAAFSTLLDPGRDVGPTDIHRVSPDMVAHAPTFPDVAGTVCNLLSGAVVVAHNADFDRSFLVAALQRAGVDTSHLPMLCTVRMTDQLLLDRVADRKMATLAPLFGLDLDGAHAAYVDTRATAAVLAGYLQIARARRIDDLAGFAGSFVGGFGACRLPTGLPGTAAPVNRPGVDELLRVDYPAVPAADALARYQPPDDPAEADAWLAKLERYRTKVSCPKCGALVARRQRNSDGRPFRACTAWRDTGCDFIQDLPHAPAAAA